MNSTTDSDPVLVQRRSRRSPVALTGVVLERNQEEKMTLCQRLERIDGPTQ